MLLPGAAGGDEAAKRSASSTSVSCARQSFTANDVPFDDLRGSAHASSKHTAEWLMAIDTYPETVDMDLTVATALANNDPYVGGRPRPAPSCPAVAGGDA